jgi:hypothetical protein
MTAALNARPPADQMPAGTFEQITIRVALDGGHLAEDYLLLSEDGEAIAVYRVLRLGQTLDFRGRTGDGLARARVLAETDLRHFPAGF